MNEEKDFSANGQLVEEIKELLRSFLGFRLLLDATFNKQCFTCPS